MTTPENGSTPIEELIGWTYAGGYGAAVWWDTPNGRVSRYEGPTVDDLTNWLRQRCPTITIDLDVNDWSLYVFQQPGRHDHHVSAPTIRDALEAAVRAVHEQENER